MPGCLAKKSCYYKSFPYPKLLDYVRVRFLKYSEIFFRVLKKHLDTEFEVQIRSGELTLDSEPTLDALQLDFESLQYIENVKKIFNDCRKLNARKVKSVSSVSELLKVAEEEAFSWFSDKIKKVQNDALRNRRQKKKKMCNQKCSSGPQIYNFTITDLPLDLMLLLGNGLKNVPILNTPQDEILDSLEQEAILASRNLFFTYYGHYPRRSPRISFSHSILDIISQSNTNTALVDQLVSLRNNFIENVPFYLSSIPSSSVKAKDLMKLVPDDCIISPSDKQVGISVLPYSWYEKEYKSQIVKGGHELVDMTEMQCLNLLKDKILKFRENCTKNQRKILKEYWPRLKIDQPRIGVLKLVPKVIYPII